MTLNELLKVVDDNTRIQIRLKMFGSTFSTNRYKNYLLNDEKEAKLLFWCSGKEHIHAYAGGSSQLPISGSRRL